MEVTEFKTVPPKNKHLISRKILGFRHLQYFLMFLATIVDYGIRTSMSVAIIAMMDPSPPHPNIPTYPHWTQKAVILSSFFWGYIIPQIGAGQLVKYLGPKWLLAVTMFLNAVFTMLVPLLASTVGEVGVIVCRAIQGLNQGFLFPSLHSLIGKWAPLAERSKAVSFVYTGGPLGTVISLPVTGLISDSTAGWPAAFYVYGGVCIAWVLLWILIAADTPAKHKSLSDEEREYIESGTADTNKEEVPTPWKSILFSLPFYAILVSHIGHAWGFWTLLTEIPSYMSAIMKYDISENGLLSALPYLALWLLGLFLSPIADILITRRWMSILNVRRMFNTIGLIGPAITLLCLAFIDSKDRDLAVALLVLAVGLIGAAYSGFTVNHIDIAPNHAGILMGFTNGLSTICSIVAPLIIQIIPREEDDPILWRYVFCIASGFYIVGNTFFLLFATGEVQPWNQPEVSNNEENGKDVVSDTKSDIAT